MKIKVDGENYKVTKKSFIKIVVLKIILIGRRISRWRHLFKLSSVLLVALLLLLWLAFGIIVSTTSNTSIVETLLTLETDIYSSVIIVIFIDFYHRITRYKRNNKEQLEIYRMILDAFDDLYEPFYGNMAGYYMPLYCDRTREQTYELVTDSKRHIPNDKIRAITDLICKKLSLLEQYNNSGAINGCDSNVLRIEIDSCSKCLYGLANDHIKFQKSYLEDLIIDASLVIDDVRSMWLWDADIHFSIIEILIEEGYEFINDFYDRMYLYSFDEIRDYETARESFENMNEQRCIEALNLIGCDVSEEFDYVTFKKGVEDRKKQREGRLF